MKTKNSIMAFTVLCLTLFGSSTVLAALVPATGQMDMIWESYSGTTSEVMVNLGAGPVSTGLISFTLDESLGESSFFNIDWDSETGSIELNLLITFPLLTDLGITDPLEIKITESGPLNSVPLVELGAMNFNIFTSSTMTGGGTVMEGPFAGFTFNNDNTFNINVTVNVGVGNGTTIQIGTGNSTSTHTGNVTQPGGTPQPTSGGGSGTTIPEPATLCLLGLGGLLLRRRKSA